MPAGKRVSNALKALVVTAVVSTAAAQYSHDPFFEQTMLQSHGYGLELLLNRLVLAETFAPPVHEDLAEQVEKSLERDVPRFLGTLRAADSALADELIAALEAVVDAVEDGEDASGAVVAAREVVLRSYDAVVGDARNDPVYIATVLADLLLADDGVAEAYEDAADDELWEYANGWAALERVKVLWAEIAPLASAERQADVQEMIDHLGTVYPVAEPPEEITGNPEEAEASAHRFVGILEEVVDASLYSGRDLGLLARHLAELLQPSLEAFEAGNVELGIEGPQAARNHYRKHLRRLLDLVAPEIHERAAQHLDALTEREDQEFPEDPAAAVRDLIEALEEAATALGG